MQAKGPQASDDDHRWDTFVLWRMTMDLTSKQNISSSGILFIWLAYILIYVLTCRNKIVYMAANFIVGITRNRQQLNYISMSDFIISTGMVLY